MRDNVNVHARGGGVAANRTAILIRPVPNCDAHLQQYWVASIYIIKGISEVHTFFEAA